MSVILLRHGNVKKDRTNPPLTPQGEREAANAGKALADQPIKAIFTSPEDRTVETAKAWGEQSGAPVKVAPQLEAWNLGAFRGKHSQAADSVVQGLIDRPGQPAPGGGESAKQYWARFVPFVLELVRDPELYGVVTHSRGIKSIEALVKGEGSGMDRETWRQPLIDTGHAVLVTREGLEPIRT